MDRYKTRGYSGGISCFSGQLTACLERRDSTGTAICRASLVLLGAVGTDLHTLLCSLQMTTYL